jgi:predicted cupin superfamily sugar epimerase
MLTPELIIERLRMKRHPERGHYVETWASSRRSSFQ